MSSFSTFSLPEYSGDLGGELSDFSASPQIEVSFPVADLHGDLLSYLEDDAARNPDDKVPRCGISQLKEGKVAIQVLPVFTETQPKSAQKGLAQVEAYRLLLVHHPLVFTPLTPATCHEACLESGKIALLPAIENASSFCEEQDTFAQGMERLRLFFGKMGRPLYIGLTWNTENRFGGGIETEIGLKEDGKRLLDFLHMKQIAIDFSHASERLSVEILEHIDQNKLVIPLLCSQSNARAITDVRRNMPDFLLDEFKKRKGLVGVNVIRPFVGSGLREDWPEHVRYLLDKIGADNVCFGAGFFCDSDLPAHRVVKSPAQGWFFPECPDASFYPHLLQILREEIKLSDEQIEKIAYGNFLNYATALWQAPERKPQVACCT